MADNTACPACGERFESSTRLYPSSDGPLFEYLVCAHCGLQRLSNPLKSGSAEAGYHPEYYGEGETKFIGGIELIRNALCLHRAQIVQRAAGKRKGTVLDIGCGNGRFLLYMARIGWTSHGTELPGPAFDRAARIPGIDLHPVSEGSLPLPDASVDAITVWHVFEHMPDPEALLRECHRVLRPAGVLIIEVPNSGSWQARWTGRHWLHLDPPRHIFQFTKPSMKQLLERAGFAVTKCSTLSLEMGALGFAQSVMNALMPRRDVFYSMLRRGISARIPTGQRFLALVLFIPLAPICAILPFLEAAAGAGSVLRVTSVPQRPGR
ncbi:MAG: class I SAM-dependent methyltransferase [bacterium]